MAPRKRNEEEVPTGRVNSYDAELAKFAAESQAMESSVRTGAMFSIRNGKLTFNDMPVPGNEMVVVILDSILTNIHYDGPFDPANPSAPTCYAYGKNESEMVPHEQVQNPVCDNCTDCPNNKFGSADTGRGKACKNGRRLAVISGGALANGRFTAVKKPVELEEAELAFLQVPPTSIKGYSMMVKQVAAALKRPPFAVFTKVSVEPDSDKQVVVNFETMGTVPDNLIGTIMKRRDEALEAINFTFEQPEEAPAPKARGGKAKAAPAKGKAAAKPAKTRGRF